MVAKRTRIKDEIIDRVLVASGRRCCLCYFLEKNKTVRRGQIAHLNRDPSNSDFGNLVWLCFDHHDEFDSTTSQSKSLRPSEVKIYRDKLYKKIGHIESDSPAPIHLEPTDKTALDRLRQRHSKELAFIQRAWRFPLWQVANQPEYFAYKAKNGADGICLIERINLPDGRVVIACLQTAGNPGQSITNSVEEICFQVCENFEISPRDLVWLENYHYMTPDEWYLVEFEKRPPKSLFQNPKWTRMTPSLWQDLKLSPKKKLRISHFQIESKIRKHFYWPTEAIL